MHKKHTYIPSETASKQEKFLCELIAPYDISLAELARKCHVTKQTMYNVFNGATPLSFPMMCALGFVLDLDPEEMWNELRGE